MGLTFGLIAPLKMPRDKPFAITRQFDGKNYSVYSARSYSTKREAENNAKDLRLQGYHARIVPYGKRWLIYIKKRRK